MYFSTAPLTEVLLPDAHSTFGTVVKTENISDDEEIARPSLPHHSFASVMPNRRMTFIKLRRTNTVRKPKKINQCIYCNQIFQSKFNLTRHVSQVHMNTNKRHRFRYSFEAVCKLCDQRFPRRIDLRRHFRYVHAEETQTTINTNVENIVTPDHSMEENPFPNQDYDAGKQIFPIFNFSGSIDRISIHLKLFIMSR